MVTPLRARGSAPPLRRLKLLASFAPVVAVVFALVAAWSAYTIVRALAEPLSLAMVVSVAVSAFFVVVTGLVAFRLGVQVPRTLRGWEDALAERAEVAPHTLRRSGRSSSR